MNIESFDDLLTAAQQQPDPQRLLFVFAKAELPRGYSAEQEQQFAAGQGGTLSPILCVDKLPEEVASFADLVVESEQTGMTWDIAFVASMAGRAGFPPTTDEAVQPLTMMMQKINSGIIADFLTFDRSGELIALS